MKLQILTALISTVLVSQAGAQVIFGPLPPPPLTAKDCQMAAAQSPLAKGYLISTAESIDPEVRVRMALLKNKSMLFHTVFDENSRAEEIKTSQATEHINLIKQI